MFWFWQIWKRQRDAQTKQRKRSLRKQRQLHGLVSLMPRHQRSNPKPWPNLQLHTYLPAGRYFHQSSPQNWIFNQTYALTCSSLHSQNSDAIPVPPSALVFNEATRSGRSADANLPQGRTFRFDDVSIMVEKRVLEFGMPELWIVSTLMIER